MQYRAKLLPSGCCQIWVAVQKCKPHFRQAAQCWAQPSRIRALIARLSAPTNTIRRRSRRHDHQRRRAGYLDRPRRRRHERGSNRELSRSHLFSNHTQVIVRLEQGRRVVRIPGRRRGQHTLRILGMEVERGDQQRICSGITSYGVRRENVRLLLRIFV